MDKQNGPNLFLNGNEPFRPQSKKVFAQTRSVLAFKLFRSKHRRKQVNLNCHSKF